MCVRVLGGREGVDCDGEGVCMCLGGEWKKEWNAMTRRCAWSDRVG